MSFVASDSEMISASHDERATQGCFIEPQLIVAPCHLTNHPDVPKVVDRFASLHPDSADGPVSYVMPRDL